MARSLGLGVALFDLASLVWARAPYASEARFAYYASHPAQAPLQQQQLDFIQNDVIKVGILKDAGGSIGWISETNNDFNVINTHDKGREVQLSYYADPADFRPDVCGKVTPWGQEWPWNPIGSGDVYGNPSRINTYQNTGTSITVHTTPLQWACKNLACECEFIVEYTLEGSAVHVNATVINHRTDGAQVSQPRDQEEPAVYTIGQLGSLYSYVGDKPWQGDLMYMFPQVGGPPWVPGGFQATEKWAAFVIDNNPGKYGLGVYQPTTTQFLAGFHGTGNSGGTADDNTGYIAPLGVKVLGAHEVYSYEFYLILGNLKDIRSFAYGKHSFGK